MGAHADTHILYDAQIKQAHLTTKTKDVFELILSSSSSSYYYSSSSSSSSSFFFFFFFRLPELQFTPAPSPRTRANVFMHGAWTGLSQTAD